MWRGVPASVILHGAVIFGGAIAWPYISPPRNSEIVVVPIDLVSVAPETNIAPSVQRQVEEPPEEPEETPPPPEEEEIPPEEEAILDEEEQPEDTFTPPPPEDEPEPEPEPEPVPDETEQAEEPEPEPEEKEPEPEPVRAEPEPDPLDDILGDASNLFDRAKDEPRKTRAAPRREIEPLEDQAPAERRRGAGDRDGMTARVESILVSQLKVCWDSVDDQPNPERLQVTVRMQLREDGSLLRDVELVKPARPPIGDRPMQVAVERALRAVRKCEPYRLPEGSAAFYDEWRDVTVNVGPAVN